MLIARVTMAAIVLLTACQWGPGADLILIGRVYTLSWSDPDGDGRPGRGAPHGLDGWRPDAEAVAIREGRVQFVGRWTEAERYRGTGTRVIDLHGATILPGLIDSHVHLANLGASIERVNLVGVETEADAVQRVVDRAATVPAGEWIVGWGWDEGAWTSRLPDMRLLSERVPNHPVILHGLHTFAVWGNRLAFERAGISAQTPAPIGGEIKKDARGQPTGILLNQASSLLTSAVPAPAPPHVAERIRAALGALAAAGYTSVHEIGADTATLEALERLDRAGRLPMAVFASVAARDGKLIARWQQAGPSPAANRLLTARGVKAFYDGAMGSRGAWFLEPYSDRPGHYGVGGADYGFDAATLAAMMRRGFQPIVHAIGDRANREALDFFERVLAETPSARETRPRIEHAQVVNAADLPRFAALGVIASMQPAHAVEDMAWAEDRIGATRLKGAYAWRSLRRAGARLLLNSDLPATDFNIFYGWHSAVTRTDKHGQPPGGWHREEALTIEEAIRGWTVWPAYAEFREHQVGVLATGRIANVTVTDIDPFQVGDRDAARLLQGRILLTVANGQIVYEAK